MADLGHVLIMTQRGRFGNWENGQIWWCFAVDGARGQIVVRGLKPFE